MGNLFSSCRKACCQGGIKKPDKIEHIPKTAYRIPKPYPPQPAEENKYSDNYANKKVEERFNLEDPDQVVETTSTKCHPKLGNDHLKPVVPPHLPEIDLSPVKKPLYEKAQQPFASEDQTVSQVSSSQTVAFKEGSGDRNYKKPSGVVEKQSITPRARAAKDQDHDSNHSKTKASEDALLPPVKTTTGKTTTLMKPLEENYKVHEAEPSRFGRNNFDVDKRRNIGAHEPPPIYDWSNSNEKTERHGRPNANFTRRSASPRKA